jgi:hypothetical protein
MKRTATISAVAAILTLGALSSAIAEDRPGATPSKRMGDEGKLPATSKMTDQVPEMGSTDADPNQAQPNRLGATPPKTMGDEGTLPATKKMGGQVPEMKGTDAK